MLRRKDIIETLAVDFDAMLSALGVELSADYDTAREMGIDAGRVMAIHWYRRYGKFLKPKKESKK